MITQLKWDLAILILSVAALASAYRLPTTLKPIEYNIHLNLSQAVFDGTSDLYEGYETVTIETADTTEIIQFHAAHDFITINEFFVEGTRFTDVTVDNDTNIVTVNLGTTIEPGHTYTMYISFTGRLSTQDMYGFYRSSYTVSGVTKYLATTQFQPVYARRAFPCFDEPAFKANFNIFITRPPGLAALSNMPVEFHNTSDIIDSDSDLTTSSFGPSPFMSSYLVAFVISEFTCTQAPNNAIQGVPYGICSTEKTAQFRQFALDIGPPLLDSLNTYTNYSYITMGFPKLDQVAIPDFAAGAMENWGLVTYRERFLLFDEDININADKQNIATIISHEFAHMWFGNLVTMEWWSETFLNEGFATYFEYFTTHDVLPDWELDKQFVTRVLQRVLETDSQASSQALQAPANSDAQVMNRFAQISYLKGGSILRMAEHIIGSDKFQEGIRSYLSEYKFQNTLPENLWTHLDQQLTDLDRLNLPGVDLGTIMNNWITQPGYPLIDVRWSNPVFVISQSGRFLLDGVNSSIKWYVPITYTLPSNTDGFYDTTVTEWLEPVGLIDVYQSAVSWIILNNQVTGYYRVNYNNLWSRITDALRADNHSSIPEVNRAALVDDAFNLARANIMTYTQVLEIVDFLSTETSHHVWTAAINGFNFLLRRVGGNSHLGQSISKHLLTLLTNVYATVPWTTTDSNDHAYSLKQSDILSLACRLGLSNCVNHALEHFGEYSLTSRLPNKNLRPIVFCNALRHSEENFHFILVWNNYQLSSNAGERVQLLNALGCTQNPTQQELYLNYSISSTSGIRPQDAITAFTAVYTGNPSGIDVAFKFLQRNYEEIADKYQSMNALPNLITGLAERFTTSDQIEELRTFINTHDLDEDFLSASTAALERAESNLEWLNQFLPELFEFYELDENGQPTTSNSTSTSAISSPTTPATSSPPSTPSPGGASTATFNLLFVFLLTTIALLCSIN